MMAKLSHIIATLFVIVVSNNTAYAAELTPDYYNKVCPQALPTIKSVVEAAVMKERRMGASLLRLHFHDCFVNGCDGSLLLDPSPTIDSEKNANPNRNSARGFDVVDQIKYEVDKACGHPVVSCADILAIAARDSVVALGGPWWEVLLGRRDSTTASKAKANADIPPPTLNLSGLIQNFAKQGLDLKDLVALSGGHTIGFARCVSFRPRLYNETTIDPSFKMSLVSICPRTGGDNNLAGLDSLTPLNFDMGYFMNIIHQKGLLHSDQQLWYGQAAELVKLYSLNPDAFWYDFSASMIKMGNIKPLTGDQGQVRYNCRKVNY